MGHARRKQAGIELQEYLPEAQIKTKCDAAFFPISYQSLSMQTKRKPVVEIKTI